MAKGCDNVFVKRLWRSVKYEAVYLNAYESMVEVKQHLSNWIDWYNQERKYQILNTTPDRKYGIVKSIEQAA